MIVGTSASDASALATLTPMTRLSSRCDAVPVDKGETARQQGRYVFECSWEVANKKSGLYSVLRGKAPVTTAELGDQYALLGPLGEANSEVELLLPDAEPMRTALQQMQEIGFKLHYGRWLIDGYPKVVLFDVDAAASNIDEWKHVSVVDPNESAPWKNDDIKKADIFGFMVAVFLQKFRMASVSDRPALLTAHFHDWKTAYGLIISRRFDFSCSHFRIAPGAAFATVFTTHATLLGRYISNKDGDLYKRLTTINAAQEAEKRGITDQYLAEREACHLAHTFTAVSEMAGLEAEMILGRKPDVITPNGLNVFKFSARHEFQNLHALAKERIHDFVRGHFHGHYDFDLDKTIYVFTTAGRYEFKNKGADLFCESMAQLNSLLKADGDATKDVTVVAVVLFPANVNGVNVESLRGQAVCKQLRDTVVRIKTSIGKRIVEKCLRSEFVTNDDILTDDEQIQLKKCLVESMLLCGITTVQRDQEPFPPICTHNMVDDAGDPVLSAFRRLQLFNRPEDRVKVVFHPALPSSASPLLGVDFDDLMRGCHLGIFPSAHEPWGYTAAECVAMGVPSITTNLSGFGCFMKKEVDNAEKFGIFVIDRRLSTDAESIEQLTRTLLDFCKLSRRQRVELRNRTYELSDLIDWKNLGLFYRQARLLALNAVFPELVEDDDYSEVERTVYDPKHY